MWRCKTFDDSLQAFVKSEGDCEERGTSLFSVEEVHKIAILDMRLGNCDRNGGNILIRKVPGKTRPEYQLIPIDHGYCLPSTFSDLSFEWAYWPQVRAADRTDGTKRLERKFSPRKAVARDSKRVNAPKQLLVLLTAFDLAAHMACT